MRDEGDGAAFLAELRNSSRMTRRCGIEFRSVHPRNDLGIVDQRPGDGDTLLLAAGELHGPVFAAVLQSTILSAAMSDPGGPGRTSRYRPSALDVLEHIQFGRRLKN